MSREIIKLEEAWRFATDPEDIGMKEQWFQTGITHWREVKIPHTFNVEPETATYRGIVWYEYRFTPTIEWEGKRVRIQFNGVYRDADIWLNGEMIGQHYNAGFTTFTIDTKDKYKIGVENHLVVRVQNNYSTAALPYGSSFDWADDGGIFRDVSFIVSGKLAFDHVRIDAKPIISSYGNRTTEAKAILEAKIALLFDESSNAPKSYEIEIYEGVDQEKSLVYQLDKMDLDDTTSVTSPKIYFDKVTLWHFDLPQLYTAVLTLKQEDHISDQISIVFGFREFLVKGHRFLLNGEPVRLCGTEWMPGSNPEYGNAEPKEYLYQTLKQLKETNCVFTRFHWQQDDAVYDWCDRNGMLIQEEIPHWGKVDEMPGKQQMDVSKQQIDEMMASHYNHPSVIMWGMGNELYGQSPELHEYVSELKAYIKQSDGVRPINYVTNTIFNGASNDATSIGDILMINEYIGTWHGNLDEIEELGEIVKENPNRPLVITEFGLCEPAFSGGDKARCELFKKKMDIYAKFPEISGIINFCLNDYRTQMGEEGHYQFRRRVHGSTDIFGEPKPSYYVVQDYCSPIEVEKLQKNLDEITIRLLVKDMLPSYLVDGYEIVFYKCGKVIGKRKIPILKPGEECEISLVEQANLIQVVRPNGFLVQELEIN